MIRTTYETCENELDCIAWECFESIWRESEGVVLPDVNLEVTAVGNSSEEKE
jgi:hypothetical protein